MQSWGNRNSCWVKCMTLFCCVESPYLTWISCNMYCYTNVDLDYSYFLRGCAQGNFVAALKLFKEQFPGKILADRQTFGHLYWELCESRLYYTRRCDLGTRNHHGIFAVEKEILHTWKNHTNCTSTKSLVTGYEPFTYLFQYMECMSVSSTFV